MNAKPSSRILASVACALLITGGCSSAAGPSDQPATSGVGVPSSPAAEAASASHADPPTPEPSATHVLPTGERAGSPVPPDPALTPPPDGSLKVEGGDAVIGELGSWSWLNAGSDAPWLPGHPIHIGPGEQLTFKMVNPVRIVSWQVRRVLPTAVPGGDGAIGMAEGMDQPITFQAPPRGTWSVSVDVLFADNQGGAVYYWAVTVD